jgi:hypothetical protein
MGWASRRRLYQEFRDRVGPLKDVEYRAIEVGYGKYDLDWRDDYFLQQVASQDLMWHKENALNLLVTTLPATWRYIAWIDADLEFLRHDWVEATITKLQRYPVVQLFSTATMLDPSNQPHDQKPGIAASTRTTRRHTAKGWINSTVLAGHPGFAWAMTREAYDHLGGFGDWGITGSGDYHMAAALFGELHYGRADMTPAVQAKWEGWADRAKAFEKNIGHVPGEIRHFWHGSKADRRYNERHFILKNADPPYDPDMDIEPDPATGLWRFTAAGERLREPLRAYFAGRNEDGVEV